MNKIPSSAKKVFQGILFDVYHWEQELFDGTFTTFEAVKRLPSTQLIVITNNNKIILLNEEQPLKGKYISFPGGIVNKGEDIFNGAKRELLEELGMTANDSNFYLYRVESSNNIKISWDTHYYIVKNPKIISKPKLDPGEKLTYFEVDFEEFVNIIQQKNFANKYFTKYVEELILNNKLEEFKKQLFN